VKKILNFLKKRWYLVLLVIIGVVGFFYQRSAAQAIVAKTDSYTVKRQTLKDELSLSGKVEADEHVVLRFQTSGLLSWVGVKEGEWIKKYQTLASLDQRDVQKRLQKYLNTYQKTRWDYDQTTEDSQLKYIGGLSEDARREALRVLDKSQFDLNNAVIDVELQDLARQYSYLNTPIEGLIVRIDSPFSGVNITPAGAEIEVVNPSTVYFSVTADQTEVIKLRDGLTAEISLDSYPDKPISGVIKSISFIPKTGETGTVYQVKLMLNQTNMNYQYRIGMTGDATFALKEIPEVIAIPTTFIKTEGKKKYVFSDAQKTKRVYIKLGMEIDNQTEVLNGLKEGDVIY